jgi:hypothetical protein
LGFLLSEVLQNRELSDPLAEYIKSLNFFPVLLRPEKGKSISMVTGNEWKVAQNIQIQTDL